jgi:hypothetical protein
MGVTGALPTAPIMGLGTRDVRTRKYRTWAAFVRWISQEMSGSKVYFVSSATSRSIRHMFLSVHFSLFDTLTPTLAKKLFNSIEFAHRYWNPKIRNVVLLVSENVRLLGHLIP